MNDRLNRTQIREVSSGKCLGTTNVAGNTIGLVDCDDKDILQRWDTTDIYGKYGVLQKAYRVAEVPKPPYNVTTTELATTAPAGSNIYITKNSTNEYIYTPANQVEYTYIPSTGAIKAVYTPNEQTNLDTCVNLTNGKLTGNSNKSYNYDEVNDNITCHTKWELLYDCAGAPPNNGYTCDRKTGEYVCAPGLYGSDCSFRNTTAANAEAAYNTFYEACVQGSLGYPNPLSNYPTVRDSCDALHNKQSWVESPLKGNFFNAQQKTDARLFDQNTTNNRILINIDTTNTSDYNTQDTIANNEIGALMTTKNNMTLTHKNNVNNLTVKKTDLEKELDDINKLPPFVPQDTEEPIKSVLSNNRIKIATIRGTLNSRTGAIEVQTQKNKTLLESYNDLLSKINKIILPKL